MTNYYLNSFQERAILIFIDKFGIDAGVEVIASFEKIGSLGKAMIAYCHSKEKYNQPLNSERKKVGSDSESPE